MEGRKKGGKLDTVINETLTKRARGKREENNLNGRDISRKIRKEYEEEGYKYDARGTIQGKRRTEKAKQ